VEQKPPGIAEVRKIHDSTLRDIPARLRDLAKRIEAGEFESLDTCAIVLAYGDDHRLAIMGYGDRSEHDTIGLTLLAGANHVAGNIG
jgi:hypothetical protein